MREGVRRQKGGGGLFWLTRMKFDRKGKMGFLDVSPLIQARVFSQDQSGFLRVKNLPTNRSTVMKETKAQHGLE